MFAVIKTGGKQYRVSQGDKLRVETLDADEGDAINLDQVMMVGEGDQVTVGAPLISGASVNAKVLGHGRGKKVDIVKFRRRKHYRRQITDQHRDWQFRPEPSSRVDAVTSRLQVHRRHMSEPVVTRGWLTE